MEIVYNIRVITLTSAIAIDPGTATTRLLVSGKSNPSVVRSFVTAGRQAAEVPVFRGGRIYDLRLAREYFQKIIRAASSGNITLTRPGFLVAVPACSSPVEQQAIVKTLRLAGARGVQMVAAPLAAALGANVDITSNRATFVVTLGQGVAEMGLLVAGNLTHTETLEFTGQSLTQHLRRHLRRYHLEVSAPEILNKLSHLTLLPAEGTLHLNGKNLETGKLQEVNLPADALQVSLLEQADDLAKAIQRQLRLLPAEFAGDLMDGGLLLTGGLAQLNGLSLYLTQKLEMPVSVVSDPENAVVLGLGQILPHINWNDIEDDEELQRVLGLIY